MTKTSLSQAVFTVPLETGFSSASSEGYVPEQGPTEFTPFCRSVKEPEKGPTELTPLCRSVKKFS